MGWTMEVERRRLETQDQDVSTEGQDLSLGALASISGWPWVGTRHSVLTGTKGNASGSRLCGPDLVQGLHVGRQGRMWRLKGI